MEMRHPGSQDGCDDQNKFGNLLDEKTLADVILAGNSGDADP